MDLLSRLTALIPGVGARTRADGDTQANERGTVAATAEQLHASALLDSVGTPVFVLGTDGRAIAWDDPITTLTGVPVAGALRSEHVSELFYPDGQRAKTLVDKVLDDPRSTNVVNGLDVADKASRLYRDTSTMMDQHGVERYVAFTAQPLFEGDELVGVVETVHDRADAMGKQWASEALIEEVSTTIENLTADNLSARASFMDDRGTLEDETLTVVSNLNEMTTRLDRLVNEIGAMAADLGGTIQWAATTTTDIESQITKQAGLLSTGAEEMQELSAGVKEIVATSDEAASAANQTRVAVGNGHEAGQNIRPATDQITDVSDELPDSVIRLQQHMVVIEEIVEVIAETTGRTNLLALNANIEVTRAGEAGEDFSVVTDKAEQPTNQTHEHIEGVTDSITEIQEQADETALAPEQSHEQIQVASGEIEDVLVPFSEIADTADSAANGITEVTRATDSQAANTEEVANKIQMAQEHTTVAEVSTTDITDATTDQAVALDTSVDRVDALIGGDAIAVEELDTMDFDDAAGSADADTDAGLVCAATDGGSNDGFGGFQFGR